MYNNKRDIGEYLLTGTKESTAAIESPVEYCG